MKNEEIIRNDNVYMQFVRVHEVHSMGYDSILQNSQTEKWRGGLEFISKRYDSFVQGYWGNVRRKQNKAKE